MRIGIDLLAAQSPQHGRRGIGRYARDLASALLRRAGADGDSYVLYRRPGLPDPRLDVSADWRDLEGPSGESAAVVVDRLVMEDPDRLDALLVLSPFEAWGSYLPPIAPDGRGDRPALASVVYDLIPFLFPPAAAPIHPHLRRGPHAARALSRFEALLAISESSRRDAIRHWNVGSDRVSNIGAATDEGRFRPPDGPMTEGDRLDLGRLGVDRPFVFFVGGMDRRKNFHGLVDAFARLPEAMRAAHQLVVACHLMPHAEAEARAHADARGVGDSLVLAGEVPDDSLARLYQRCALFAFPSLYEGFGLPILEAMRCGAAVVAADNSSQPEVVGEAGLLADAGDPSAFAAKMAAILGDPALAAALRARSRAQASRFSWSLVAERARAAIAGAVERRDRPARARPHRPAKPPLAMVSPLPPRASGIADYAARLVEELRRDYRVDLFHDGAYAPLPSLADPDFAAADVRVLPLLARHRDYRAIVYQMGNSTYHQFLYPALLEYPGVVTLHDFCLAGFHQLLGRDRGLGSEPFRRELAYSHPGGHGDILEILDESWPRIDPAMLACAGRGLWLNRRVLEAAEAVVVHSPWCLGRIREQGESLAEKAEVIPLGATPEEVPPARKAAIRSRFGVPADALVVASFGFVHPDKMSPEALSAFVPLARTHPGALFLFAGADADGGAVRAESVRLGLSDRARFLGRLPAEDFHDLLAITDIGVSLRRPPTLGETSAALLDLLRFGVPTIVTDTGTFRDYPPGTVAPLRWPEDGAGGLALLMKALADDPERRAAMGHAAREHVRKFHRWPDVAARYVALIERTAARRGRRRVPALARGAS